MPPNFRQAGDDDHDLENALLPTGNDGYAAP